MHVQSATSAPAAAPAAQATSELADLVNGGASLDGPAFAHAAAAAGPDGVANVLRSLPPAQQGFVEAALSRQGLGHLLGGVGQVAATPGKLADAAVYTPSERRQDQLREAQQDQWLNQMRGQAELDRVLAPYIKEDRPSGAQAWSAEVRGVTDDREDRR